MNTSQNFYSTQQVSHRLHSEGIEKSAKDVADMARNEIFPNAYKIGNTWSIPVQDIEDYIQKEISARETSYNEEAKREQKPSMNVLSKSWWNGVNGIAAIVAVIIAIVSLMFVDFPTFRPPGEPSANDSVPTPNQTEVTDSFSVTNTVVTPPEKSATTEVVISTPTSSRSARHIHKEADAKFLAQGYKEAKELVKQAIELDPEIGSFYTLLGKTHKALGEFDEAIENLETAVDMGESDTDARYHLGSIYQQQEKFQLAIEVLSEGIVEGNYSPAYYVRGLSYKGLNAWNEADSDFSMAIDVALSTDKPENVSAYFQRGIIRCLQEKYEEAKNDFNKVLRLTDYNNLILRSQKILGSIDNDTPPHCEY